MHDATGVFLSIIGSEGFISFMNTYQVFMSLTLIVATVIIITAFILSVVALAKSGGNPMERMAAISKITANFICLMAIGSIDLMYGLIFMLMTGTT